MESTLEIDEPFPIFLVRDRYLLFEPDTIAYARREHHILGVLLGNIPGVNQQNVFNSVPVQLMPEEAHLLVKNGHAYIVDDVVAHRSPFLPHEKDRKAYLAELRKRGLGFAEEVQRQKDLKKVAWASASPPTAREGRKLEPLSITPVTSYPPLSASRSNASQLLPPVTKSYPIFEFLHSKGYYMSPGLRFGCTYTCYPGDPLRYHSHFLVVGKEWDEPIELIEIVGGGRLSTGVKKSWLVGGEQPKEDGIGEGTARAFCFEWAAM